MPSDFARELLFGANTLPPAVGAPGGRAWWDREKLTAFLPAFVAEVDAVMASGAAAAGSLGHAAPPKAS